MQIDKKYRLEKAVSTDPSREHLQNVWVTKHHAFATNGHILAAVPVSMENGDTAGLISVDALKLARKSSKGMDTIRIGLNGAQILSDGTSMKRPDSCKPPRILGILRSAHRCRTFRVGINSDYLKELSAAIGSDELILELGKPDEAILIRPLHHEDGVRALIMPIRINDKKRR